MHAAAPSDTPLTRNQMLVLGELTGAEGPLSAYRILDRLRDEGFRAPLQVYRALDKLLELGLVHRLESMNAFVACNDHACTTHAATVFAICETCGRVAELSDQGLESRLHKLTAESGFRPSRSIVELRGLCADCRGADS
ncbi:transcriptional repressor [Pseudohoeflea sp. DP4N28-3]|uniref:Transcriptional repressor n=2 Tax=Pseudohoeflea coraliihabitans TaxID=2860393 RepID=A0ABS6WM98_9HYPH|nr:Fur family transcriptional regulator [Pseudohoeflea sp. DP4N28-3]MBW3097066.1 transcriptional repressor [Pseudohoeflea sp. DP4N28-3]